MSKGFVTLIDDICTTIFDTLIWRSEHLHIHFDSVLVIPIIYAQDVDYAGGIPHLVENDTRKKKKCLLPCTPLAVIKILEHIKVYDESLAVGDRMKDKTVCVINRSEVVGRPLAALLANDGASVYSFDISGVYLMQRGEISEVCSFERF